MSDKRSPEQRGPVKEFVNAAVYSAIEEPVLGLVQICDKTVGTQMYGGTERGFKSVGISAPTPCKFGTDNWASQQLGSAVGMTLPFLLTQRAVKSGSSLVIGEARAYQGMRDAALLSRSSFAGFAGREAGMAAVTGFTYDALLRPTHDDKGDLLGSRIHAGINGAAIFTTLSASNLYLHRFGVTNPIASGLISSIPAGGMAAELGALDSGRWLPTWQEAKETIGGFAFVGTTLGAAHHMGRQSDGAARTNVDRFIDKVVAGNEADAAQQTSRTFKHVGNEVALDKFVNDVSSGQSAQLTIPVREHLGRGLFGGGLFTGTDTLSRLGLWGDKFGETRQMLLTHDGPAVTKLSAGEAGLIATCAPLDGTLRTRDAFPSRSGSADPVWLRRAEHNRLILSTELPTSIPEGMGEPVRLGSERPKSSWELRDLERKAVVDELTQGLDAADRTVVAENLRSGDANEVRQSLTGKDLVACVRAWKHCPFMEPPLAQELGTYLANVEPSMQKVVAEHVNSSLFFSSEKLAAYLAELPKHDLTACTNVWRTHPRMPAPAAEKLGRQLEFIPKESQAAVCDYCTSRTWEIEKLMASPPGTLEAVAHCSPHMKYCTPSMAIELWPLIKDVSSAARELACKHLEASFSSNAESLKGVNLDSCVTAWEKNIRLSPDAASALHPLIEGLTPEAKQLVCKHVASGALDAARVQEQLGGRNLANCAVTWEVNPYMEPLSADRFGEVARNMEPEQRKAAASYLGSDGYGLDRALPIWRLNPKVSAEATSMLSHVFEKQKLSEPTMKAVCDYVVEHNLKNSSVPMLHLEDCALVWQHNARVHPHDAAALGRFIDNLPPDVQRAVCDRAAHLGQADIHTLTGVDLNAAAPVWALGEFDVSPELAARIGPEIARVAPAERGAAIKPVLQWIDQMESRYGGKELLDKVGERLQGRDLEACAKVWTVDPTVRPSLAEKLAAVIGDTQNPDTALAVCKYAKDSKVQSKQVAERFAGRNLDACAEAWKHVPELPPSIAERFASYSAREKVAATMAWDEMNRAGISPDKVAGEFQPVQDRYMQMSPKDLHEMYVERGSESLYLLLDSMRGPRLGREAVSMTAPEIDAMHTVLSAETKRAARRNDTADGAERNAVDTRRAYYEAARTLNVNVYRDAVAALNSSTPYGGGQHWQATSAAKLALTFNKDSGAWLDKCAKNGLNGHDATYWLPADANAGTNGLRQFLNQNMRKGSTPAHQQQMLSDIRLLTKEWNNLPQPERDGLLSGTAAMGDVAMEVKARTRYPGTKNVAFAAESATWGTSRREYKEYEGRFIESQNTPSPFPLEKTWTDSNLTGRFLPRNDVRGVYLGEHTNCCQHPGDAGAACAWYGQESRRSGFFVVENKAGEVVAQSWAWVSDNGRLCFDSIESKGLGTREPAVMKIYQDAATELAQKHKTVTVGSSKVNLSHLPKAGDRLRNCRKTTVVILTTIQMQGIKEFWLSRRRSLRSVAAELHRGRMPRVR